MTKQDIAIYPKRPLKCYCLSVLIFLGLLFGNRATEANDTSYITQWLNSRSDPHNLSDIHIGFFYLNLTTPDLTDNERVTTSEEFNLDSASFNSLLSVYFGLHHQTQNLPAETNELRRFALSVLLEVFNTNLQSAHQTTENRQQLQEQFRQFYETFATSPLTPRWAGNHQHIPPRDITFSDYFNTDSFVSENSFTNANNGLMALMYAILAPFIFSQQNASACCAQSRQAWEMHDHFDLIQNAFIRKSSLRRSTKNRAHFAPNNPNMSMFQNLNSLIHHVEQNNLQGELLLLMSLRSFAFYAYQTLALETSPQTDFSQIIREYLTRDISSVLAQNILEGRVRAYGVNPQANQLANAFECGILASTSRLSVFLWMQASHIISRFRQQDQANSQRLFDILLGGKPVFPEVSHQIPEVSQQRRSSTAGQSAPATLSSVSDAIRQLLQSISTDGLINPEDLESEVNRDLAIRSFISNIHSALTAPERPTTRREPSRGSTHYSSLAEEIAAALNRTPTYTNPGTSRQTSSIDSETLTQNLNLLSHDISTLSSHLTEHGLLQENPPPPDEVRTTYDFLRGYLSYSLRGRVGASEPHLHYGYAMPSPNQHSQGNTDSQASHSQMQNTATVPSFGFGDVCIFCIEKKTPMAWLSSCGHGNFCPDCLTRWERENRRKTCPICRGSYRTYQRREYMPPEDDSNQDK